jgi:membrane protein implicated in regulation of membrane protease activity
MKRRIFAWVLLIGFVLLLLNLIVFRFYWQLSMVVYLVIVFAFMLMNGKLMNTQSKDEDNRSQGNEDIDTLTDDDIPMAIDENNADNNDKK